MSANAEAAKSFLAKKPPKLDASADAVLLPNGEITRVWEGVSPELIDPLKAYLFEFTDLANDGTPSKFVDGLKAQGKLNVSGILRNARITSGRDPNNENQYFVKQTLRSGYARAPDYGEAIIESAVYANTNANAVGITNGTSQNPMLSYVLRFPNIAPNTQEIFRAGLMSGTVSAPTVQNQIGTPIQLTGTWNTVKAEDRQEDDGSHSILLTIAQSIYVLIGYTGRGTARESTDHYIYNLPLDVAQQIVTDFGALDTGTRRSASISYRDSDKMVDVILRYKTAPAIDLTDVRLETTCRFYRNATYSFAVADPLDAAYDIPSTVTSPGHTFEKRVTENGDGTYDVVIVETVRLNQTLSYISEADASKTTTTDLDLGRTSAPSPLVQAAGTIKRRNITVLEDCTYDVKDDSIIPIDQQGTAYESSPSESTQETLHTESAIPLPQPSPETGKIKRSDSVPTDAGNWRTTERITVPTDQTGETREESPAKSETATTHTEGPQLAAPASTQGIIRRHISEPTKAGNFATRAIEVQPKNQTASDSDESAAASSVTTKNTESTIPASGTAATGTRRIIRNVPTEAGNFQTSDEIITPRDQTASDMSDSGSATVLSEKHTENPSAVSGSAVPGTRRTIRNIPTEFGNFRTEDEVVTPKDQTSSDHSDSAAATVLAQKHTENPSEVSGAATSGTRRTIRNIPTEFGNFRTEDEVVTPKDQTAIDYSDSASASSTSEKHTENPSAVTGSALPGTRRTIRNIATEVGNFRTEDEVVTPKDQTATNTASSAAATSIEVRHTENPSQVTGAASPGTKRVIRNIPTEVGNFATSDETTTPIDQTATDYTDSASASIVSEKHTENASPVSGSATPGTRRTIRNVPTEFGTYRTEDEVVTPKNQQSTNTEDDAYFSRTTERQTQNPTPISGTASVGTVRRIINNVTDVGYFETTDDVQTQKSVPTAQEFKTVDADGTSYTLVKHGQTAADSLPSSYSAGDPINEVLNKLTEHQRYNIESRSKTPGTAFISDWFAFDDVDGTNYYRVFVNVAPATLAAGGAGSPQEGMTDETSNSLQPRRNQWGLYDGVATRKAGGGASLTSGVQTFERDYYTERYQFASIGGVRKKRKLTLHIGIKQTTSEMAAAGYLVGHENGKIVALSGGRVFRATYCDIISFGGTDGWVSDE